MGINECGPPIVAVSTSSWDAEGKETTTTKFLIDSDKKDAYCAKKLEEGIKCGKKAACEHTGGSKVKWIDCERARCSAIKKACNGPAKLAKKNCRKVVYSGTYTR